MKSEKRNGVYVEIDGGPTQDIAHAIPITHLHHAEYTAAQPQPVYSQPVNAQPVNAQPVNTQASSYGYPEYEHPGQVNMGVPMQTYDGYTESYMQPEMHYMHQEPLPSFDTGYVAHPPQQYAYQQAYFAQHTQQVRLLPQVTPQPIPRRPAKRANRWRRPLFWVLSSTLLGCVALGSALAFGIVNSGTISDIQNNITMPAIGLPAEEESKAAGAIPLVDEPGNSTVIAEAFARPARKADLSLTVAGLVSQMYVEEGSEVEADQLLLSLDNSQQLVAVAKAKANLSQAQARLSELTAGSHSEEILAAQAVVQAAKGNLASLQHQRSPVDEQAAEAQLRAAEAALNALYRDPEGADVIAATAELRNAQAAVARTQNAYNQVKWRNDAGMLPEAENLQEATNNFEAAQAKLDLLYREPTPNDISQAQARVSEATAELERVRNPTKAGDIEAAEAEVRKAEAELRLLQSGTRPEAIAFAQAELDAAQAALLEAEVALQQTELRAPFNGTVVSLNSEVGEYLQPGVTIARIGDLTNWQFETNDLIELDIINVAQDAAVRISVDAMPEINLTGKVLRTRKIGENKVGDITYTVYIEPDRNVPGLAWNMTASVHIDKGDLP